MGHYEKAIEAYKAFIKQTDLEQQKKLCHSNIAICYFKLNQFKECIGQYNEVIKIDENFPKAYFLKAKCYKELHDYYSAYQNALTFTNLS